MTNTVIDFLTTFLVILTEIFSHFCLLNFLRAVEKVYTTFVFKSTANNSTVAIFHCLKLTVECSKNYFKCSIPAFKIIKKTFL